MQEILQEIVQETEEAEEGSVHTLFQWAAAALCPGEVWVVSLQWPFLGGDFDLGVEASLDVGL